MSVLGVAVGFLVYLAAAVAGVATVFAEVPTAYAALRLAGPGIGLSQVRSWRTPRGRW